MADRSVSVFLRADISDYNRKMLEAAGATKGLDKSLNSSNDRMSNLVQTSLALGPALVPISAAAVPAITGLSNQLGIGAAAAGVTVIAFKGLGKALDAVNKAQLDPTAANIQALNLQMSQLGPAGQDFVLFLQKARPEMQRLQELSRAGLFPGLEKGLHSLSGLLPDVEHFITTISTTLGDLGAEAGANLDSPKWHEFIAFLDKEARPTLLAMGRTAGNFAEGLANLWMAFAPLSNDFSGSFLGLSRDFAKWTDGLDKTQGFQDFIAYVSKEGPRVFDTLGSVANALLQIVEAAAPVGSAVLPVISAVSDAIATLANSDLGPVIIGVISLTAAVSRMKAIGISANSGALGGLLKGGYSGFGASVKAAAPASLKLAAQATNELRVAEEKLAISRRAAVDAQSALVPTSTKRQALGNYMTDLRNVAKAESAATEASRARNIQVAKGAAAAAGLAVIVSGTSDKLGLANTATLALAGSLAGPWGAAVGAGVGLAIDFAKRTDDVGKSLERANAAASNSSLSIQQRVAAVNAEIAAVNQSKAAYISHEEVLRRQANPGAKPGDFGPVDTGKFDSAGTKLKATRDQLTQAAQNQAFAEAGLAGRLANSSKATRDETYALIENIRVKNEAADAAENAFSAETSYRQALKDAQKQARTNNAGIEGNSDAALKNRESLDTLATAWNRVADAGNATSSDMKKARANFIQVAEGMGVSKKAAIELFGELAHKVAVNVKDNASPVILTVLHNLGRLRDKTITIRTNNETHVSTITGGGRTGSSSAAGNIFTAYAGGGVESHIAQIGNGNQSRVWNEPETKGEAYIPLADDWRRPRAVSIWQETGRLLGMNQAFRAREVAGIRSAQGGGGSSVMSVSLVGHKVALDKDGFGTFVDGRIEIGISQANNYAGGKR